MGGALIALAFIAAANAIEPLVNWAREGELFNLVSLGWVLAGLVVACAVLFGLSQIWWAQAGFRLTDEGIDFKRGVFQKQVRSARYDRIQAVDVVEPLVARIFGLAGVRVEVAGGASSAIEISYLPRAEAEQLRAEVLSRAEAKAERQPEAPQASHAPLVPPIPIGRSLAATALQISTIVSLAAICAPLLTGLTFAAAVPVLVGALPLVWRTVDQSWRFTASLDGLIEGRDDGVWNLTYGLANRRRQSLPQRRIHAVEVKQPLLWRPFGWWTVSVNSAGYGAESAAATGTSKLLPVGSWEQAMAVVAALGIVEPAELAAGQPDYGTPPRAKWVSPIDWRQQSASVRRSTAVVTFGRATRRFQMVELPHVQELSLTQGPLQRAMGVAHVRLDLVPGPVRMTARDLDERVARELMERLRTRPLPALEAVPLPHG